MRNVSLVSALALLAVMFLGSAPASADHGNTPVGVRITIEHVHQSGGCFDPYCWAGGEADFYAHMEIAGMVHETSYVGDDNNISPNWEFEYSWIPLSATKAPIRIEIWDADGGLRGDDDKADIHPFSGKILTGAVEWNFDESGVIGSPKLKIYKANPDGAHYVQDLTPNGPDTFLGQTVQFSGNSGDEATIRFKVDMFLPSGGISVEEPGQKTRALGIHSPVHPSETDNLTITGGLIDEFGQPITSDDIQIWFDADGLEPRPNAPLFTCPAGVSSCSTTVDLTAVSGLGSRIAYGVYAWDEANHRTVAWSGWRIAAVGDQGDVDVIPISVGTKQTTHAVDILLLPEGVDYYSGGSCSSAGSSPDLVVTCTGDIDAAKWSEDIGVLLGGSIFSSADWSKTIALDPTGKLTHSDLLVYKQDTLNIWYSSVPAYVPVPTAEEIEARGHDARCTILVSDEFKSNNDSFDVMAVIHRTPWRDCAPSGTFSTEPGNLADGTFNSRSLSTFLHELGHKPFGNSDIYCKADGTSCDGGYSQQDPYPNLYASQDACDEDSVLGSLGKPVPAANSKPCPSFTSNKGDDWFRPEPPNSLMGSHHNIDPATGAYSQYGPASVNRILWYFGKCEDGGC